MVRPPGLWTAKCGQVAGSFTIRLHASQFPKWDGKEHCRRTRHASNDAWRGYLWRIPFAGFDLRHFDFAEEWGAPDNSLSVGNLSQFSNIEAHVFFNWEDDSPIIAAQITNLLRRANWNLDLPMKVKPESPHIGIKVAVNDWPLDVLVRTSLIPTPTPDEIAADEQITARAMAARDALLLELTDNGIEASRFSTPSRYPRGAVFVSIGSRRNPLQERRWGEQMDRFRQRAAEIIARTNPVLAKAMSESPERPAWWERRDNEFAEAVYRMIEKTNAPLAKLFRSRWNDPASRAVERDRLYREYSGLDRWKLGF